MMYLFYRLGIARLLVSQSIIHISQSLLFYHTFITDTWEPNSISLRSLVILVMNCNFWEATKDSSSPTYNEC